MEGRATFSDSPFDIDSDPCALPPAVVVALGMDGWIVVELGGLDEMGPSEVEGEVRGLWRLEPALDCLRTSLAVAGREREKGMRALGRLRGLLREVRASWAIWSIGCVCG